MLGALLALASAALFGLQSAAVRRAVTSSSPLQGMAITVPSGVPLFAALALFFGGFDAMPGWPASTWLWAGVAGIIHFVIGRFGNYHATQALGGTLSTPIQQLSVIVALVLAVLFLQESISGLNFVGIGLVIFGPMVMLSRRKKNAGKRAGSDFEPNFRSGLIWGLVSAFGYGSSPLFVALALRSAGPVEAPFGNAIGVLFVSYGCASVIVIGVIMMAGGVKVVRSIPKSGLNWYLFSSVLVALSQLFRYMALVVAPVSVVVPIQRLSAIFRLLFNAMLNRKDERLDPMVIVGIILSIFGAAALGVDTKTALDWLDLGPELTGLLSWRF